MPCYVGHDIADSIRAAIKKMYGYTYKHVCTQLIFIFVYLDSMYHKVQLIISRMAIHLQSHICACTFCPQEAPHVHNILSQMHARILPNCLHLGAGAGCATVMYILAQWPDVPLWCTIFHLGSVAGCAILKQILAQQPNNASESWRGAAITDIAPVAQPSIIIRTCT